MRYRIWEWIAVNQHLRLVLPAQRICVIIENQLIPSAGINQYTGIKVMKQSLFTPNGCLLHLIKKFITYAILQMFHQQHYVMTGVQKLDVQKISMETAYMKWILILNTALTLPCCLCVITTVYIPYCFKENNSVQVCSSCCQVQKSYCVCTIVCMYVCTIHFT